MRSIWYFVFTALGGSWVAYDASKHGARHGRLGGGPFDMGPVGWFFSVVVFWIIGFPGYLWVRPRFVALLEPSAQGYGDPRQVAAVGDSYGGPLAAQAYPIPMRPVESGPPLPPRDYAGPPPGAPRSPDGHWWWDGADWQPNGQ